MGVKNAVRLGEEFRSASTIGDNPNRSAVSENMETQSSPMPYRSMKWTCSAVIDSAASEDDPAAWRKTVGWVAPHLNATLRMLGLSPETRKVRDQYKEHEPDALDRLRAARRLQLHPDEQARVDADSSRLTEMRQRAIGWAKDGDTMQ